MGQSTGKGSASYKDGSDKPGAGTRKPVPQPTREPFPVKTSAKTDDQEFGSFGK